MLYSQEIARMVALLGLSLYCHVSVFIICLFLMMTMRESRKFCQRGSNSGNFFLVMRGEKKNPNTATISGPSSARRLNAI